MSELYATIQTRALSVPTTTEEKWERKRVANEKLRESGKKRHPKQIERPSTDGRYLVLDDETDTKHTQSLTFGSGKVVDIRDGQAVVVGEVLFHPDDYGQTHPTEYATLGEYAAGHRADVAAVPEADPVLHLVPRRTFMHKWVKDCVAVGGTIVGFNLAFDVARLATAAGVSRSKKLVAAFSLVLFDNNKYHPRLHMKKVNAGHRWDQTAPAKWEGRGAHPWPTTKVRVVKDGTTKHVDRYCQIKLADLSLLAWALRNMRFSLKGACKEWKVEDGKYDASEHGVVTAEYIDYNRQDVTATTNLLVAMLADYNQHPNGGLPWTLFSTASLAKRYKEDVFGVTPRMELQPDLDLPTMGQHMSAFFGGRSEVHIRHECLPVLTHDFTSMYPSVHVLMDLWRFHVAAELSFRDSTKEVLRLLRTFVADDLYDPRTWKRLNNIVEVLPSRDVLPVRTQYGMEGDPSRNIGINYLSSETPIWYTLADVLASFVITNKMPRVLRAVEMVASTEQMPTLKEGRLYGRIPVDPRREDPIKKMVELRQTNRADGTPYKNTPEGLAMKTYVNGSYGFLGEFNATDLPTGDQGAVTVHDGVHDPYQVEALHPEEPGKWIVAPLAAYTTAGARLMLAMMERAVTDAGGTWVFADTDSFAIVATEDGGLLPCAGGAHVVGGKAAVKALSYDECAEIRRRFDVDLNPYDRTIIPAMVKPERDKSGWCYAVSSKRYATFTYTYNERGDVSGVAIVDGKEHGLGHLLNPAVGWHDPRTAYTEDDGGQGEGINTSRTAWVRDAWKHIIEEHLYAVGVMKLKPESPTYFDHPAVGQFAVTSVHLLDTLTAINNGKTYDQQIKPGGFLLTATRADTIINDGPVGRLLGPFERDATKWQDTRWIDAKTGEVVGRVDLKTVGLVVALHRRSTESTFDGPDGYPCQYDTRGQLSRRHVHVIGRATIGKEGNLADAVTADVVADDPVVTYKNERTDHTSPRWRWSTALQVLKGRELEEVLDVLAGWGNRRDRFTVHGFKKAQAVYFRTLSDTPAKVRQIIDQRTRGGVPERDALFKAAVALAWSDLDSLGVKVEEAEQIDSLLTHWFKAKTDGLFERASRECGCGCGLLVTGRAIYAGAACRKRVSRTAAAS